MEVFFQGFVRNVPGVETRRLQLHCCHCSALRKKFCRLPGYFSKIANRKTVQDKKNFQKELRKTFVHLPPVSIPSQQMVRKNNRWIHIFSQKMVSRTVLVHFNFN